MPALTPENYACLHLWWGIPGVTKVVFINKETGKIRPIRIKGEEVHFPFIDEKKVKAEGFKILTGKKRTAFLSRFGLMVDQTNKTIRRKKR